MDWITLLQAGILGLIEGATEFLPISSTGHLILAQDVMGFDHPSAKVFTVVVQLGAILAICWLYRQKLFDVAFHIHKRKQQAFAFKIMAAFMPAGVIGFFFHGFIKEVLFAPLVVAIMLVVGGVIIIIVERYKPAPVTHDVDDITLKQAFMIGCCQAVAIIPGTSRSGATIVGGLLMKLDRKVAAEFSFFLAIPVMMAATVYDIYKNWDILSFDDAGLIAVGLITSFLAGLAAVKFLIRYISNHSFIPFAIYRIVFGLFLLFVYF
jgi:undecaprenyl-diphosphatase